MNQQKINFTNDLINISERFAELLADAKQLQARWVTRDFGNQSTGITDAELDEHTDFAPLTQNDVILAMNGIGTILTAAGSDQDANYPAGAFARMHR